MEILGPQYLEFFVSEISFRYGNPECFQVNSVQCELLCHALRDVGAVKEAEIYLHHKYPSAWKEIYRAVKEAEIYLHHCSSGDPPLKFLTRSTTGEAYSLHLHDLALCLLLVDMILETDISNLSNRICDFYKKMDRFMKIRYEYADEVQLLKICKQFAERSTRTTEDKDIVKVSKFLGGKLEGIIPISVPTEVESAGADTPIPKWLEINPADLVLKTLIGEGSYGRVYEGSWLGVRVAAKEMPMDACDVFELEASVLAKLQSPFVVNLIGTCVKDSRLYLVMELVSSTLSQLLEDRSNGDRPPLSLPVAVDIMLQISRAMEYLHSQGIMHLDLKASNVLFELSSVPELREEGYGRVKLCDFGTASTRVFSFRVSDPKGTCYWRAPEVFPPPNEDWSAETSSPEKYTNKADVYSFGMTCYEILTGKQPFAGVLPRDLYAKIVNGERPTLKPSMCPFILANYIEHWWDTDPDHRPCFEGVSIFLRKLKLVLLSSGFNWNYQDKQGLNLMRAAQRVRKRFEMEAWARDRLIRMSMILMEPTPRQSMILMEPTPRKRMMEARVRQMMNEAEPWRKMIMAIEKDTWQEPTPRKRMMEARVRQRMNEAGPWRKMIMAIEKDTWQEPAIIVDEKEAWEVADALMMRIAEGCYSEVPRAFQMLLGVSFFRRLSIMEGMVEERIMEGTDQGRTMDMEGEARKRMMEARQRIMEMEARAHKMMEASAEDDAGSVEGVEFLDFGGREQSGPHKLCGGGEEEE